MRFEANTEQTIQAGKYNFQFIANGGTADLQQSIDGAGFTSIPDGALSADTSAIIEIATCRIRADLTGAAVLVMSKAK